MSETRTTGPANSGNAETNPPPDSGFNLTTTDNVTLEGDGSDVSPVQIKAVQTDASLTGSGTVADPLAVASAPPTAPTVEHVDGVGPVAADPTLDVTFASYNGPLPEGPLNCVISLADGVVDGFVKAIACPAVANVTYKITPTNPLGFATLDSTDSGPLGATLVWDDTAGGWRVLSKEAP